MESTTNNNKNYGERLQQLQRSPRKRKFNELSDEGLGQLAAAEAQQIQQQSPENLNKKNCDEQQGNDDLENLQLESLTRKDLIQLDQKQLANQNEVHNKQLEAVKKDKEAVEAKQQAKEMTTKVEELEKALLASEQKVEELTAVMANQLNLEHQQKHLDSAKKAEKFSQRIVQLEQEKAKVQEELHKKLAEIEEMHKEVEEKSGEIAEKAKQIGALLLQLNESPRTQTICKVSHRPQIGLPPTKEEMKIQLSLETWFDWLGFVPRHRLGKIVPMIGDRKFGSIVQKFLHEYGEIMIDCIKIVAPYKEDPDGHPRVRVWQNNRPLRFEMAETQMPANIKTFNKFEMSYLDQSVLNFMQKFQQNGLLDNVNLGFAKLPSKDILPTVLCHIMPLINAIATVDVDDSAQLVDIYKASNSQEIHELSMKMMEKTRTLKASYDLENLHANRIDLYCCWLYQTARADGKPRVLKFGRVNADSAPISLFIDRLKKDFLMATDPVTFSIQINLPNTFKPLEDICLDNDKTKERFLTKMKDEFWVLVLHISRYPQASIKKRPVENEKEVLAWIGSIYFTEELQIVHT